MYKGQKLTKLVKANIPATTINIMPKVPEITLVKNKIAINAAITNRIMRSADPMFVFIIIQFLHFQSRLFQLLCTNLLLLRWESSDIYHSSKIITLCTPCSIFPSISSFFINRLTTSLAVPSSLAICR